MPRDSKTMPICSPAKLECEEEAIEYVETTAYDPNGPLQTCQCLPACSEMKFPFAMSQGKLDSAKNLKISSDLKAALPELNNDNFVKENWAIIHIYHENLHFLKHERGEVSKNSFYIDSSSIIH